MPTAMPIKKPRTILSPLDPVVTSCKILSPRLKSANPLGVDPHDVSVGSEYVVMEYVVSTVRDGAGVVDGDIEGDTELDTEVSTDDAVLVMLVLVMFADVQARALFFTSHPDSRGYLVLLRYINVGVLYIMLHDKSSEASRLCKRGVNNVGKRPLVVVNRGHFYDDDATAPAHTVVVYRSRTSKA